MKKKYAKEKNYEIWKNLIKKIKEFMKKNI